MGHGHFQRSESCNWRRRRIEEHLMCSTKDQRVPKNLVGIAVKLA